MLFQEQELLEVIEGVWLPTLELAVQPAEHLDDVEELLACEIELHGAFNGSVCLVSSRVMLDQAAAMMFDQAAEDATDADARDALAELTNMAAGIIKSVLPEPTDLSLPQKLDADAWPAPDDADAFGAFTCHGEPIFLVICETAPA